MSVQNPQLYVEAHCDILFEFDLVLIHILLFAGITFHVFS